VLLRTAYIIRPGSLNASLTRWFPTCQVDQGWHRDQDFGDEPYIVPDSGPGSWYFPGSARTRVSFQSRRGGTKRIASAQSDAVINTANVRTGEVKRLRGKLAGSQASSNARMQAEASALTAQTFQGAGKPKEATAAAIIAQGISRRASLCEKKWIHMRLRGPSSAG